ncbi:MAG: hypothetical protein EOO14_09145 [Chitinophagaceae bacterium]|nr:MAG: hypothetical protein EOO14_09145 [Chitinophagaceae bacterium]
MKLNVLAAFSTLGFILFLYSCTKLNEPTELGDELLPAVDNVNTFDTTLILDASYYPFNDSSRHLLAENLALGKINDPVFGTTTADMYFNLSSTVHFTVTINKDLIPALPWELPLLPLRSLRIPSLSFKKAIPPNLLMYSV